MKESRLTVLAIICLTLVPTLAVAEEAEQQAERPQNAWVVNCSSGNAGAELACQMSQNLTERDSGKRVLTVTIRKQGEDGLAMLFALPHGLFLPSGATYQIDDGARTAVAIQTSDPNGAYAAVPLDEGLLTAMKQGVNLKIGMESVSRQPVTIPVSLAGFTVAVDKLLAVN